METVIGVIKDIISGITSGNFDINAIIDLIKGIIGNITGGSSEEEEPTETEE